MFDDQVNGAGGQVPGNLPIGEPEDMFGEVDPTPPVEAPPAAPVPAEAPVAAPEQPPIQESQVAAPVDESPIDSASAIGAGKLQPAGSMNAPVTEQPMAPPTPVVMPTPETMPELTAMPPEKLQEPSFIRSLLVVVIIIVIASVIGGMLWFVYATFIATPKVVESNGPTPAVVDFVEEPPFEEELIEEEIVEEPTPLGDRATTTQEETREDILEDQILFGEPIDTDEDQLDDDREIEFGTDPRNWDTDGDGLSDGEEILNWGTDALIPDTDGDGFDDGDEVQSGYSPTQGGGARLFEVAPINTSTDSDL